jgi:uncharacterized membrane protein
MSWRRHAVLALVLMVAVHLMSVWAFPRVVMAVVLRDMPAVTDAGQAFLPPPPDHLQRRIVLPSPDLLYALCPYDLSRAPLHITAAPASGRYWSIALYADNTDNFFVLNDREATGAPVSLWLRAAGTPSGGLPAGSRVVTAPSPRGLLLMRVLHGGGDLAAGEAARQTLRCRAG